MYYGIPTFRGNAVSASARAGMPQILPEISTLEDEDMVKGKAIPLEAWTGPKGSRRLRLPDFKTIDT